jgi:hypothetical protein
MLRAVLVLDRFLEFLQGLYGVAPHQQSSYRGYIVHHHTSYAFPTSPARSGVVETKRHDHALTPIDVVLAYRAEPPICRLPNPLEESEIPCQDSWR